MQRGAGARELGGEETQQARDRIRCGLAEAADGCVAQGLREGLQARGVPVVRADLFEQLLGAEAAGRALAAGLVGEEGEQVVGDGAQFVLVREHDDRRRADEAAVGLQGVEVEREVGERGGEDAARGAAGQVGEQAMAGLHAAAVLVHQLAQRDAGGGQVHAGLVHPPRHREAAQPAAPAPALAGEGSAGGEQRDPVQGLDVVHQRGAAEEAELGDEGRAVARLARLAFERLDQRRLLAADVGAGAATQHDEAGRGEAGGLELADRLAQYRVQAGVFVAQVEVDRRRVDGERARQRAFEHPVRRGLQIVAVLEGARLAFVGVDHEVARRGAGAHRLPLARGREAGAAQPAQAGFGEPGLKRVDGGRAAAQALHQGVAAGGAIGGEALPGDGLGFEVAVRERSPDRGRGGVGQVAATELGDRGLLAAPHAGRAQHADVCRVELGVERRPQRLRAGELAGQRVAHAHGERRRRGLALAHHVEVGVEGGGLVHLGHRQVHPVGERAQVAQREVAEAVLQRMQVLDELVAIAAGAGEQGLELVERGGVGLAAAQAGTGAATGGGLER